MKTVLYFTPYYAPPHLGSNGWGVALVTPQSLCCRCLCHCHVIVKYSVIIKYSIIMQNSIIIQYTVIMQNSVKVQYLDIRHCDVLHHWSVVLGHRPVVLCHQHVVLFHVEIEIGIISWGRILIRIWIRIRTTKSK